MDANTTINTVVNSAIPTPFGWVMMAQDNFDIGSMLAFTKQLSSLSRGLGNSVPVEQAAPVLSSTRP